MKGRRRLKEIIDGWHNYIIRNPTTEAEALRRAEFCVNCEYRTFVNTCSICNCPLAVKTRSGDSKCPHPDGNKWKK
jgi:hypothetical protein